MKVYEKINQLKGTNASIKQIKSWAYMNRILPCYFDEELDIEKYPNELRKAHYKVCVDIKMDCMKCLDMFLESELEEKV